MRTPKLTARRLEPRLAPALFTVTNGLDGGPGSFRQAILNANGAAGLDTITFDPAVSKIGLTSGPIIVTGDLQVNGPGAAKLAIDGNALGFTPLVTDGPGTISVALNDLTVTNGKAANGGGLLVNGDSLTLTRCRVVGNAASSLGGGVFAVGGSTVRLVDTLVSGNSATNAGGGLYFTSNVSVSVESSAVTGNTSANGGGLCFNGVQGTTGWAITNSTVSGNKATGGQGGGIVFGGGVTGTFNVRNATVTANTTVSGGGGIGVLGGTLVIALESSVVAGNTAGFGPDFNAPSVSAKSSAIGSLASVGKFTDFGGNLPVGTAVKLGPLADNGGPTPTHLPQTGSPIINAGSNPLALPTDQRGQPRVQGFIPDIGAVETPVPPIVVTNANDGGPGSLRQAVLDANAKFGPDTITFDPVAFASPATITLTGGPIFLSSELILQGPGAANLTVSGTKSFTVFIANDGIAASVPVVLHGLTVANGGSANGGGVSVGGESVTLRECVVRDSAASSGGGVHVGAGGTLTLHRSHVTGNSATIAGGGIYLTNNASVLVIDSTVSANKAQSGGGLALSYTPGSSGWTVRNSTVSGNQATSGFGGGIAMIGSNLLTVQNSTVTANSSTTNGGGISGSGTTTISLTSSVVSGNTGSAPDIVAGKVSAGTSAVGSKTGITTFDDLGGNLAFGTAAKLAALADNGGPTPTHLPLSGSPLINVGSNPLALEFDQRGPGFPRGQNGLPDIGAAEATVVFTVTNTNAEGTGSLRQAVLDANAFAGTDTVVFDPFVFSKPQTITLTTGGPILITSPMTIQGPGANLLSVSGNKSVIVFKVTDSTAASIAVTLAGLTVTQGFGTNGAGVQVNNESVTVTDSVVSNNVGTAPGGGIHVGNNGSLTLVRTHVTGNTAAGAGGGLYLQTNTNLSVVDSTISANAAFTGGGIALPNSPGPNGWVIRNSTISGNQATSGSGGGINVSSTAVLTVQNSTVTANKAAAGAGGLSSGGTTTFVLDGTIVSNNTGSVPDLQTPGKVTARHSAIGSISGVGTFDNQGGNLAFGTDLKLNILANNGGPTPTHLPQAGSPLRDAGINPASLTFDQRGPGFPRVLGSAPDIGAVESFSTLIVTNTNDTGTGSLRQAVITAASLPGAEQIEFDPAVFATPQTIKLSSAPIQINSPLTIAGPGASLVTVSAQSLFPVFIVSDGTPTSIAVTLSGITVTKGQGSSGGGVSVGSENLTIRDAVLSANNSTGLGGGVHVNTGGTLTLVRTHVTGNTAATAGGGVYLTPNASLLIQDSTLSANKAGSGGGMALTNGTGPAGWVIRNSTISGNQATAGFGGGVAIGGVGSLTVQNSTVVSNTANGGSGGIAATGAATIGLESTVVSGNSGTNGDISTSGGPVSARTSAVGSYGTIGPFTDLGGNLPLGIPVGLMVLADNGGPTPTHALFADSPLLNAGSNPAGLPTDQRGFARVVGGAIDIGAVEAGVFPPRVVATVVNDGSAQRSRVTSLTLTFDRAVTLAAGAFALTRNSDGAAVTVNATAFGAAVVLTFSGGPLEFGSLADGRYTLTAVASKITSGGMNLDGNGNGVAGDDYTFTLHRLFGDSDGNAAVNFNDFLAFRTAFGTGGSSPFDFNDDGQVNFTDFLAFRARFGVTLAP